MLNLTKGGLKPAKIVNLTTQAEVNFMFNPYEFTVSKSVSWTDGEEQGVNAPKSIFNRGQPRKISLTLHFDAQDRGSDVRNFTQKLWEMALIDTSTTNARTGKALPPPVAFSWGRLYFKAIITEISEKFTLFDEHGTPLRSEIGISLQEYIETETDGNAATIGTVGTLAAAPAPRTATVTGSNRLDNVVSQAGSGVSSWRDVAESNNIDNPLNIPTGTTLRLPRG